MCFLILQKFFKISKTIFFHLAPFRRGFPTNKQIHRLNQNALVSLSSDSITKEKIEINVIANPNTIFLAPTNSTVNNVNNFVIDVLFSNHTPLMTITNGLQRPMMVYRNMSYYNRKQVCNFLPYFIAVNNDNNYTLICNF